MSVINKMLQDLDRRQGMSHPDATMAMPQVRTVSAARKDREWFWRIVAALMVASVGWVAWIAWQLQPREPVATPLAFKAAQNASRNPPVAQTPAKPVPAAPVAVEQKPAVSAVAEAEKPAARAVGTIKLSQGSGTPIREHLPKPTAKSQPKPAAAPATRANPGVPPARILETPAQVQGPVRVEKKDRVRTAEDRAESDFRRGAALLNQGRATEAEEAFAAAITAYPGHEAARQALVAVNLEYGRIDVARRLLQEGVALNAGNPRFATVLARIHMERRDYAAALDVMNGVKMPELNGPELQSMRGSVLQKMGRHAEAAEAFQISLRAMPQNGAAWLGLGVSLDALGKRSEAAESFRRAAATGMLGSEASSYAEQRARQLQ